MRYLASIARDHQKPHHDISCTAMITTSHELALDLAICERANKYLVSAKAIVDQTAPTASPWRVYNVEKLWRSQRSVESHKPATGLCYIWSKSKKCTYTKAANATTKQPTYLSATIMSTIIAMKSKMMMPHRHLVEEVISTSCVATVALRILVSLRLAALLISSSKPMWISVSSPIARATDVVPFTDSYMESSASSCSIQPPRTRYRKVQNFHVSLLIIRDVISPVEPR